MAILADGSCYLDGYVEDVIDGAASRHFLFLRCSTISWRPKFRGSPQATVVLRRPSQFVFLHVQASRWPRSLSELTKKLFCRKMRHLA
jgi:hypothetical protein